MSTPFDKLLDARGLNCPMPLIRARGAVESIGPGEVLKVIATDPGSIADFKSWVKVARGLELIAQETDSAGGQVLYIHYVKKR